MISAEAPVLFAKAAQIFITELTLRAWIHTEDNKRRTLQVTLLSCMNSSSSFPLSPTCFASSSFASVIFLLFLCVCPITSLFRVFPSSVRLLPVSWGSIPASPLRSLRRFSYFSLYWLWKWSQVGTSDPLFIWCHFACSAVLKLSKMDSEVMWRGNEAGNLRPMKLTLVEIWLQLVLPGC